MGQPRLHQITKGLALPIKGAPSQHIKQGATVTKVALVADDYLYMKPSMRVKEGETVKRGQALFEDRKAPGAVYTAPGAGKVVEINRGDRRKLLSVVIELNENELKGTAGAEDLQAYDSYKGSDVSKYDLQSMKQLLSDSGLWTAIRVRPMSRVPALEENTEALFVTAMDSNPLAADTAVVLAGKEEDFALGLKALSLITQGALYVCGAPQQQETLVKATNGISNANVELFAGPHPAGLVGTHIHFIHPVNRERKAWHIGFQDVIAVGRLIKTGHLDVERVISIAGPAVFDPSLVKTRLGAEVAPLVKAFLPEREFRIIDGSAFYGRTVNGSHAKTEGYLGRYRNQLTCLLEDRERVFFGWLIPGAEKFSVTRAFSSVFALGAFGGEKKFDFTTTTHGSHRAMVPIGMYERIMHFIFMLTSLLRPLWLDVRERQKRWVA